MVLKLLIVILTLLVLGTSTQKLSPFQIDLYKYDFIKDQDKRYDSADGLYPEIQTMPKSSLCTADKKICNPLPRWTSNQNNMKRAWKQEKLNLINLLLSLPREDISEPVIFGSDEYENWPEK